MIGGMLIIFLLIPESPWWLAGKGKVDKAAKVLQRYNGHLEGYNVDEMIVSLFFAPPFYSLSLYFATSRLFN